MNPFTEQEALFLRRMNRGFRGALLVLALFLGLMAIGLGLAVGPTRGSLVNLTPDMTLPLVTVLVWRLEPLLPPLALCLMGIAGTVLLFVRRPDHALFIAAICLAGLLLLTVITLLGVALPLHQILTQLTAGS